MKRKTRPGEHVCSCQAYRFPHRFGGGRCSGYWVVLEQWEQSYGCAGVCRHCNSFNQTEAVPYCEVVAGGESVRQCPAWQEYVRINEIKVKE